MSRTPIQIMDISFDGAGNAQITYVVTDNDIKDCGAARTQTLLVPKGFEYDDEIRAVQEAADYLVRDVLDDWDQLPVAEPQ